MVSPRSGKVPDLFQARNSPARNSAVGSLAEGGGKEPHPIKGGGCARECLENGLREVERACFDGLGSRLELHEEGSDVDAPMCRGVRREPPARLLELAFAADSVA